MASCTAWQLCCRSLASGCLAVLPAEGCISYPEPPPATPRTLLCVIDELSRLGYSITTPDAQSEWYQAFRSRDGGGDQIWLRLTGDSLRPSQLDLRATGWAQQPPRGSLTSPPGTILVPPTAEQSQADSRTALDRCAGRSHE